jgi:hypothetical protein
MSWHVHFVGQYLYLSFLDGLPFTNFSPFSKDILHNRLRAAFRRSATLIAFFLSSFFFSIDNFALNVFGIEIW